MNTLPVELQKEIIYFSFDRHILIYVCQSWNKMVKSIPVTSTLLSDISNNDLYAIKYKCHCKDEEFSHHEIITKIFEVNNDEITKVLIYFHCPHYIPDHRTATVESKFVFDDET